MKRCGDAKNEDLPVMQTMVASTGSIYYGRVAVFVENMDNLFVREARRC